MLFMALQGVFTTDKPIQGKALSCMCLEGTWKVNSRASQDRRLVRRFWNFRHYSQHDSKPGNIDFAHAILCS